MLAPLAQVVGGVGPGVGVSLTVATADAVLVGRLHLAAQRLVEILDMLNAEVGLQREALDGNELGVGIAEDAPRVVAVVASVVQCLHGVGHVRGEQLHGAAEHAVGGIYRQGGVLTHGNVWNSRVGTRSEAAVVPVGHHEVLTHVEILVHIESGVDAASEAAVVGIFHEALLVDVVAREEIGALVGRVAHAGRDVVGPGSAIDLFLPVGVGGLDAVVRLDELRRAARAVEA